MIFNFFLGGIIFVIIEYIVNVINNTALAAVISMIPIGYLSTLLIKNRNILTNYVRNIFFVVITTLLSTGIFYLILKYGKKIDNKVAISLGTIIWICLQFLNYKLNIFKNDSSIDE